MLLRGDKDDENKQNITLISHKQNSTLAMSVCGKRQNITIVGIGVFLGFTRAFCSKSEWGSTQNVLMIMLYRSEKISRNCPQQSQQQLS